jgi:hypothetical protein
MLCMVLAHLFNCELAKSYVTRLRLCGVPDNVQMVLNNFVEIGWRGVPLVSNLTCLFEFQFIPNRRRLMRRGCTLGLFPRESGTVTF